MNTPVFTSPVILANTQSKNQSNQIWTCDNDVLITDMIFFVNGTQDNLPIDSIKIKIGYLGTFNEWCEEVEIKNVQAGNYASLADLSPGYPRRYFAGGDDIYLQIVSPPNKEVQFTLFSFGFPY